VRIAVRPWTTVADFEDTSSEITQTVLETLRMHGVVLSLPQREVRLLNAE